MSDEVDQVNGSFLIAPTEPSALKRIGTSSSLPENYGVDVLWASEHLGLCGVQRKEIKDLTQSMQDGRLAKEVAQMNGKLGMKMVMVEGRGEWGLNGSFMSAYGERVTRQQVRNYLYSVRSKGVWIEFSDDLQDTIEAVRGLRRWTEKEKHTALLARPGPTGSPDWGKVGRREWAIHLLCGFPGIGPHMAEAIIDHFGEVPLRWEVTEKELLEVSGIGKTRAKKLIQALEEM